MQELGETNGDLDKLLDDSMEIIEDDGNFDTSQDDSNVDFDALDAANYEMTGNAFVSEAVNVGNTGFGESQWDEGASLDEVTREGGLNKRRALLQPWSDQAANAVTQMVVGEAIGGTIEGIGYLLDFEGMYNLARGQEKEYTNWFSELGSSIKEGTQDATQIYEKNPGEMNLFDTGYWFKNSVSIASTLSIMIPGMAGAKAARFLGKAIGKSLAKGANKIGKAAGRTLAKEAAENGIKLGVRGEWMADGLTQAFVSRHIENTMEAKGTLDAVMQARLQDGVINKATGLPYTEEEARMEASAAAAENYQKGWAMILQDIPQYLAIGKVFNPITKQMEVAKRVGAKNILGSRGTKVANVLGSFASEAAEEGYQGYISSKAHLNADLAAGLITKEDYNEQVAEILGSDESKTAMLFGGLGGSVFSAVGPKFNELTKSKSRKELEARAAEYRAANMAMKQSQYEAMNVRKQEAESRGDAAARQIAQDDIMASMIIDGLENNNLEEVMESLASGADMSPEQIAALEERIGGKFDAELAKEGAARALEMAEEIKTSYFSKLQSKKNKNVENSIVAAEVLAEFQNKNFVKEQKNLKDANGDLVNDMKFDESTKPSDEWMASRKLQTAESAERYYLETLQAIHNKAKGKEKDFYAEQIKIQKAKIKKAKKATNAAKSNQLKVAAEKKLADKQAMKGMSPKEKEAFKKELAEEKEAQDLLDKQNEETYSSKEFDLVTNMINSNVLGMRISQNNRKIKDFRDPAYRKEVKLDNYKMSMQEADSSEELDAYEKNLDSLAKEYTAEEIAEVKELIKERRAELKAEEKKAKQEAEDAKTRQDLADKAAAKNEDPTVPDSNVNNAIEDVVEDHHSPEETDHTESIQKQQETVLETVTGSGRTFSPLDEGDINNVAYNDWLLNGEKKIGQTVGYRLAGRGDYKRRGSKSAQAEAVREFDKAVALAKATGQPIVISDFVYDNYPLEMYVADGTENTKTKKLTGVASIKEGASKKEMDRYNNGTRPERVAIINALAKGEQPTSTIKHSGGGTLQNDINEDGTPAINSLKELEQFRDGQPIELVYSNEKGELMTIDKKRIHPDFPTTMLTVGTKDDNGNDIAYSGGVFVIMKKADGTTFPVKLNMARNSRAQAELVAKLLVDITVPPGQKDETTGKFPPRKYTTQTIIGTMEQEDLDAMRDVFGVEMELLGENATLYDMISMFTHMSEKTEGMSTELMMSGNFLKFDGNKEIRPDNNNEQMMSELADFIEQVKPRPFSIKKWNDTANFPGYREFVLDNRILNTDVTKEGPAFKSSEKDSEGNVKRRVQVYVAPLAPSETESAPGKIDANKGIEVKEPLVDDVVFEDDGRPVAETTGDPSMDIVENDGPTNVDINKAVYDKYPGLGYNMPMTKQDDGTYKTMLGTTVTAKEYADLQKFKSDFVNDARKKVAEEKMAKRRAELDAEQAKQATPTTQTNDVNLGTKTAPKGGKVVVDKVKGKSPQPGAVVAFRTKGKTEQQMIKALEDNAVGNPFGPYGAIKANATGEAVNRFLNWLQGTGDTNIMQDYRNAILAKAPELKGKTIFYYKDLGRPSHATALDYFLNKPTQQISSDATEAASDKSIEMLEIEADNNDVFFNYFEGKWDVMKGNVVVAQGVSKMGAIDKAIEEPASTKTVVIKGKNNKDNTYVVEGDVIKNSKGKEVYSKPSKMREKIMSQEATNDLTLFDDTADLLVDPNISKEEMNAFLTEEGAPVLEERLRYLVAMQASGKKLSVQEYMMLDSKSSRIEASKVSDVSQSNDTKISKEDKKVVPLPSSGKKAIKSNSLFGRRKVVKKNVPAKPTKEDVNGAQDQGNEDTTC